MSAQAVTNEMEILSVDIFPVHKMIRSDRKVLTVSLHTELGQATPKISSNINGVLRGPVVIPAPLEIDLQ